MYHTFVLKVNGNKIKKEFYVMQRTSNNEKLNYLTDITTSTFDAFDNSLRQKKTPGIIFVFFVKISYKYCNENNF